MKQLVSILFIIHALAFSTFAQQEVVVLSSDMFKSHQRIFLAQMDGWMFNQGHDDQWAEPYLDVKGWQKMSLVNISPAFENEKGRIEGWFRLKFRLDESFQNIPLYLSRSLWAATDIYLDGALIHSFGNTGYPYQAFNPILKYPVPIELEVGKEYLLAVHFVDYESTFTQREIRLTPQNLASFLNLTGPDYISWVDRDHKHTHIYVTLCIGVSFLLCFLYWFLVYLNPDQSIFRIIAWFTTAVLIGTLVIFGNTFFEISYFLEKVRFLFSITLQATLVIFGLFILEWILTQRTSKTSWAILASLLVANILAHVFSISFPFAILFMIMILHFGRLFLTYANSISGAKWAILAGYIIATLATVVYIGLHKYDLDLYNEYDKLLLSMTILTTPLFLLAYISVRFKETLEAQKLEAKKVLEIAEEKKEILANQNLLLEKQVNERTLELKNSLETLKSTQAQLIHAEKMASLGELTAGIAHEIQNPLNFVNNFSEVSVELVEEIREVRSERREARGKKQETRTKTCLPDRQDQEKDESEELEEEILEDIRQNLEKIQHHGKRADAIVKGMLEHSRTSTGEKVPTDINALADEYLRLAYHGMRAKDKSFSCEYQTDFDPNLPKVNIIPQDIGRVLLNVINNAFQACTSPQPPQGGVDLLPTVFVKTRMVKSPSGDLGVEISIKDNGPGIPDDIKDKIFQPFFTTKPTGQGTGLGLSLSYDIVKAHGGRITMNSIHAKSKSEGQSNLVTGQTGTEFCIELPLNEPIKKQLK